MKLTIEPTQHFFMAGDERSDASSGVMVRMWQGHDDAGQPCVALVTAVAFTGQATALSEGLVSIPPPDAAAAQRWAEQILRQPGKDPPDG